MANDLADMLRAQLKDAAREAAKNMAGDSAEKPEKSSSLSGLKALVVGAGITLIAKKGVDVARKGGPAFVTDLSERINAKLLDIQGESDEEPPEAEADDEEAEPKSAGDKSAAGRATNRPGGRAKSAAKTEATERNAKPGGRAKKSTGGKTRASARS